MNTQQCVNPVPTVLKPFMAVKMVGAGPLTRGAYDQWKGQDTPVPYKPDDDGYLVQYYGGYISWCPKQEFERFNMPLSEYGSITSSDIEFMLGQVTVETREPKTTLVEVNMLTSFIDGETSHCVRTSDYNESIGAENALSKIRDRLWGHLGFMLQWAMNGLVDNQLPEVDETDSEPALTEQERKDLVSAE